MKVAAVCDLRVVLPALQVVFKGVVHVQSGY